MSQGGAGEGSRVDEERREQGQGGEGEERGIQGERVMGESTVRDERVRGIGSRKRG